MDEQEFDSDAEVERDPPTVSGVSFDWGEDDADVSDSVGTDVLRFDLGGLSFAIETRHVMEVGAAPMLTQIPGLPPHVVGVAVRRRHVLSIVDFSLFMGIGKPGTAGDRLLVLDVDGLEAGIVVGNVVGPEVWPEDAEPPNMADLGDQVRKYVVAARWAPGGRVLLLDLPELLRAAAVR